MDKKSYDFSHVWDIKKGNKWAKKRIDEDNRVRVSIEVGCRGDKEVKGGRIPGDGKRLTCGRWAHNRACTCHIIKLYTWNVYSVIHQCSPNKFNLKKKVICMLGSYFIIVNVLIWAIIILLKWAIIELYKMNKIHKWLFIWAENSNLGCGFK